MTLTTYVRVKVIGEVVPFFNIYQQIASEDFAICITRIARI